jgi:TRAP-type C4-dicarboxylate transport system substrate-binding protein
MSQRAWQELSPEDRVIFRTAARESSKYMRGQWQRWEEQSRKQTEEGGVTIINTIDRKPFEAATKAMRDGLRTDPRFRSLVERIEAVQ